MQTLDYFLTVENDSWAVDDPTYLYLWDLTRGPEDMDICK